MFSAGKFTSGWLPALLRHELRLLLHNRPAVFVLILLAIAPLILRWRTPQQPEAETYDCYVLYWQEDDWVRALRRAARADANRNLHISVVPAKSMADRDGLINYPAGAHSIQIRPLPPNRDNRPRWMIWCWYAGANPDAMSPYTRWFWDVTGRHFDKGPAWVVRYSPLRAPVSSPLAGTSLQRRMSRSPVQTIQIGLLMLALFYCACYLPVLGLTQDRAQQTIISVALTPAGWGGVAIAKWLFHLVLAFAMAVWVVAVSNPSGFASVQFWATLVLALVAYLGLGLVVGSLCRSPVSAGAAMVAYALINAGLMYASVYTGSVWPSVLSIEHNAYVLLFENWSTGNGSAAGVGSFVGLCVLACVWELLAVVCFRRSTRT